MLPHESTTADHKIVFTQSGYRRNTTMRPVRKATGNSRHTLGGVRGEDGTDQEVACTQ